MPASTVASHGKCGVKQAWFAHSAAPPSMKWAARSKPRKSLTPNSGRRCGFYGQRASASGAIAATPRPSPCQSDCATWKPSFAAMPIIQCAFRASLRFRPIADISVHVTRSSHEGTLLGRCRTVVHWLLVSKRSSTRAVAGYNRALDSLARGREAVFLLRPLLRALWTRRGGRNFHPAGFGRTACG